MTLLVCQMAVANHTDFVVTDPTLPALANLSLCDNNNDGFSSFDLTSQDAIILAAQSSAASNYSITYHENLTDAEIGTNAIASPYYNISPNSQIIYVRITNINTSSYIVGSFQLIVSNAPFANGPQSFSSCDNYGTSYDGVGIIDLTQYNFPILNGQDPSLYSVTYYTTQISAEAGFGPIIPATNYISASGETIWARVENYGTGCYALTTINITISPSPLVYAPSPLSVCDDDANPTDQHHSFDLTVKNNEIANGTGNTITYYQSLSDAQSNTNPIATPTNYTNVPPAVQTVGVRVWNGPLGCFSITTLDIRVYPIPTPNTNPPALTQCDYNNTGDMMEVFDLTVNAAYIANGDPNLAFHYFQTQTDAVNQTNEIVTPTAALVGSNVWIRVENNRVDYQGNHCYVLVEQPIHVYPLPNLIIISNNTLNTVYVDGSNNVVQPLLLDSQLSGNYSYHWQVDGAPIASANNSTYLVDTAILGGGDRVFEVSVQDLNTGCTSSDSIIVSQSTGVPSPSGPISQIFNPGQTLAYLTVSGSNILWYALATNKNTTSTPLPLSTLLADGTTYYASQTIGGMESAARLPVTVYTALGMPNNEILSLKYAPNPVKDVLSLESSSILKLVQVYNLLGQKVYEKSFNNTHALIDLSNLNTGNYVVKVQGEMGQKTVKIIKQ